MSSNSQYRLATAGIGLLAAFAVSRMPLSDPDEALFACVARTMVDSGDWIVPYDRGRPFLDRPILHYWLLCLGEGLGIAGDWRMRLPSVGCGFAAIWIVGRIAGSWFGKDFVLPTVRCAAAMPAFWLATIAVGHDSSLLASVAAAIACNLRLLDATGRKRFVWAIGLGFALGLGVLAKGLLGLALPMFAVVPMAWSRGKYPWRHWAIGLAIAAILGGSWYLTLERRVPGSLNYFFVERHIGGYLSAEQRHGGRSAWIYLPTLLLGGLPWTATALWHFGLHVVARRTPHDGTRSGVLATKRDEHDATLASSGPIWCWFLATVGFFCLAGSKNPTYLLPAFLPAAILAGASEYKHDKSRSTDLHPNVRYNIWLIALLSALFAVNPFVWQQRTAALAIEQVREAALVEPTLAAAASSASTWWYFHVPPSARWHAPDLSLREVNAGDLSQIPSTPTVLICRDSQVAAAKATPFGAAARWLPARCRYHVAFHPGS